MAKIKSASKISSKENRTPRSASLRGEKGGRQMGKREEGKNSEAVKEGIHNYTTQLAKGVQAIGLKGGAAALAGGAAGVVIGATLGAAITNRHKKKLVNKIADDTRNAAEEISKRVKDLKEITN